MKKKLLLVTALVFLNGCYGSATLIGPASGIASGKVAQSAISTTVSYAIKNKTGKSPIEHAATYAETNSKKKQKTIKCVSFLENTSKEFCSLIEDRFVKIQNSINKSSKIKKLD